MPPDPYAPTNPWWQQQQGPRQGAQFAAPPPPQQPLKPWWQGVPMAKSQVGKGDDQSGPSKQPSPGLMQMLMLGGPATYSGTPTAGAPGATSPWGWLGGMFGGPSAGGPR